MEAHERRPGGGGIRSGGGDHELSVSLPSAGPEPREPLAATAGRAPHCGRCDSRTRMIEVGDDRLPRRCPYCHPHFVAPPSGPSGRSASTAAANVDSAWKAGAMAAISVLAEMGVPFTASDLRQDPFALPEPASPAHWGAVFLAAARRGVIERIGDEPSTVAGRNGSRVTLWRGRRES